MVKQQIVQWVHGLNMTREEAEETLKSNKVKVKKYRQRRQMGDEPTVMPDWKRIEEENNYLRSLQRK